jgi:nucleoside-diphosphate-sugar epimerase
MPLKNLIIGCGYLGSVAACRWLAARHRVAGLTRSRAEELRAIGIEPVLGDVTDPNLRLPTADTVLYAVGLDRSSGKSMREVYVGGLANVLAALPEVRRFVYISSTSVYGQTGGEWVDEASPTEPVEESGRVGLECERLLRERRPNAVVLRFAGIYGPARVIRRADVERGEPLAADPAGWLNLIHVEDGAAAVLAAAEQGEPGAIYNVTDDRPVTRREFYTEMAALLGAPSPRFAAATERSNRRVSNRRMRSELGVELQFPDFRTGLRDAIGDRSVR